MQSAAQDGVFSVKEAPRQWPSGGDVLLKGEQWLNLCRCLNVEELEAGKQVADCEKLSIHRKSSICTGGRI